MHRSAANECQDFTPTVGLGCRSGGYLIFTIIALSVFAAELLVWWLTPDGTSSPPWLGNHTPQNPITRLGSNLVHRLSRADSDKWSLIPAARFRFHQAYRWWTGLTFRDSIEIFVLRPCEIVNVTWLFYITSAQTFGIYQSCNCKASTWSAIGVRTDPRFSCPRCSMSALGLYWFRKFQVLPWSWRGDILGMGQGFSPADTCAVWLTISGMTLPCTVMAVGFTFVVYEYCTQSHLSTEDYEKAKQGLRWTRWFKKYTSFFRSLPDHVVKLAKRVSHRLLGSRVSQDRCSLVWAVEARHSEIPRVVIEDQGSNGADEPGISPIEGSITSADVLLQTLQTAQ